MKLSLVLVIFGLASLCSLAHGRFVIRHKRNVDIDGSMPVETVIIADESNPQPSVSEQLKASSTEKSVKPEKEAGSSNEKPVTETVELAINPVDGTAVFGGRFPLFSDFNDFDRSLEDVFTSMRKFADFYRQTLNENRDIPRRRFGLFPMVNTGFGEDSMFTPHRLFDDVLPDTSLSSSENDKVEEKTEIVEINGVKYRVRNKKMHKKGPNGEMIVQSTIYEPIKDGEDDSKEKDGSFSSSGSGASELEKEDKKLLSAESEDSKVQSDEKLAKIVDQKPNLVDGDKSDKDEKIKKDKKDDSDEDD